jgi:hypothetical protein
VQWEEPKTVGADAENRKVSYHASGRIKGGASMSTSVSIRDIERPTWIRQDEYAHPSRFAVVQPGEIRATDIVIPGQNGEPYELLQDYPLTSRVFAAPLRSGDAQVSIVDDDPHARAAQTAIVVPATNLRDCQDVTYQIQFFNRPGAWPEISTIAILNTEEP